MALDSCFYLELYKALKCYATFYFLKFSSFKLFISIWRKNLVVKNSVVSNVTFFFQSSLHLLFPQTILSGSLRLTWQNLFRQLLMPLHFPGKVQTRASKFFKSKNEIWNWDQTFHPKPSLISTNSFPFLLDSLRPSSERPFHLSLLSISCIKASQGTIQIALYWSIFNQFNLHELSAGFRYCFLHQFHHVYI